MNEAASRLLLEKLKVDDAMLRVAQTKGAISNKEMELFLAPAPTTHRTKASGSRGSKTGGACKMSSPLRHRRTGVEPSIGHTSRPVLTAGNKAATSDDDQTLS